MYTASVLKVREFERGDLANSIEHCKEILSKYGFQVLYQSEVEPTMSILKEAIFSASRNSELVVIMGGTGLLWEDIATEAVFSLIDKRAQGLEISMIHNVLRKGSEFLLYRCAAGTIQNSVVLSIPGKTEGIEWYLEPVLNTIKTLLNEWRKKHHDAIKTHR